ncbi:MAG: orotidine-5'-phosphate decarboxylase [Eubacteriaceae bacterium]|nr:orotidine-5'-phosphate decarboxylase [Eubacteriaceae bacterium]
MGKDVIIACDFPGQSELFDFLSKLNKQKPYLKIGLEMFCKYGPELVKRLKGEGYGIFLDLKLHDIPNTVRGAAKSVAALGVDMLNVHAAGGKEMMRSALEGLREGGSSKTLLIAVTQLTSTNRAVMNEEILIPGTVENAVASYAKNAEASGLNGVVCSPLEIGKIKSICGSDFITVTPGIRYPNTDSQDQKRVSSPGDAKEMGGDYIVVGRPITQSDDPNSSYERFKNDFV